MSINSSPLFGARTPSPSRLRPKTTKSQTPSKLTQGSDSFKRSNATTKYVDPEGREQIEDPRNAIIRNWNDGVMHIGWQQDAGARTPNPNLGPVEKL